MVLETGKPKLVSSASSFVSSDVSSTPLRTAGAALTPAPPPVKSIWVAKSIAGRSIAPRSNAPSQMLKSVLGGNASKVDPDMADRLQNLRLSNQKPAAPEAYYDPSLAPEPDALPDAWQGSAAPSENSVGNYNVNVRTESCRRYKRTVADFKPGEIIALPFHEPNLNPNNKMSSNCLRLTKTCEGPVFSKRRMLVILHIHTTDMFCLPLYSFEGRGLGAKPNRMWPE